MVFIVTGTTGIGKTTVCRAVIRIVRNRGYSCGGIITYKTATEDIIIEDVQTGTVKPFASTRNIYQGPRTEKYFFNPDSIDFGIQAIDSGATADVTVVDELGPLELNGQGFVKVINMIVTGKFRNCLIVIRNSLLSTFLPRLGTITSIFETTSDNRNQLPFDIAQVLVQIFQKENN